MPERDRPHAGKDLRLPGRVLQAAASVRGWAVRAAAAEASGVALDQPQVSRPSELYSVAQ